MFGSKSDRQNHSSRSQAHRDSKDNRSTNDVLENFKSLSIDDQQPGGGPATEKKKRTNMSGKFWIACPVGCTMSLRDIPNPRPRPMPVYPDTNSRKDMHAYNKAMRLWKQEYSMWEFETCSCEHAYWCKAHGEFVPGIEVKEKITKPRERQTPDDCHKWGYYCKPHKTWVPDADALEDRRLGRPCHTDGYFCKEHNEWIPMVVIRENLAPGEHEQNPSTCHTSNENQASAAMQFDGSPMAAQRELWCDLQPDGYSPAPISYGGYTTGRNLTGPSGLSPYGSGSAVQSSSMTNENHFVGTSSISRWVADSTESRPGTESYGPRDSYNLACSSESNQVPPNEEGFPSSSSSGVQSYSLQSYGAQSELSYIRTSSYYNEPLASSQDGGGQSNQVQVQMDPSGDQNYGKGRLPERGPGSCSYPSAWSDWYLNEEGTCNERYRLLAPNEYDWEDDRT
ncbi:hypothetical protein BJ875DRAFT_446861 [Amylocarpus encephaloides]|uniref:Uncharacterized protein n=1 Tax=Amylocarpus encephaloides TaxID=45428 RepID=A0A9P7Y7U5_9HELO|nr:hypothetical protein BJ875DRAFT_446861 [Amylocarpus encephaloides]